MNRVAAETPRERAALFRATGAHRKTTPAVAEKDFWVCWVLARLFPAPEAQPSLLFKGGTSLSKAYGAIARFSEDIDLSLDPALFGEPLDEAPRLSGTQRRRLFDRVVLAGRAYLAGVLLPRLREEFAAVLGEEGWALDVSGENPDALVFAYPLATDRSGYVPQRLLLEFGVRSERDPWEPREVRPYAADAVPEAFATPAVEVPTLTLGRTFWEKATLLHAVHHQPDARSVRRMSRHYADLAALAAHPLGRDAARDVGLLERVARHKAVFYAASHARYDLAAPGTLRLAPHPALAARLEADYRDMREMFFGEGPVRPFGEIVAELADLEARINAR